MSQTKHDFRTLWITTAVQTASVVIDHRHIIVDPPPVWHRFRYESLGTLKRWLGRKFGKVQVVDITPRQQGAMC